MRKVQYSLGFLTTTAVNKRLLKSSPPTRGECHLNSNK